ncbi:hypothetical protein B0O80DRAFT_228116 [Mortierella sp. GBAus27b]|nr:hypothetical protein B0O80DRAFT_228116 [Mortierella sp. GBAus27b]
MMMCEHFVDGSHDGVVGDGGMREKRRDASDCRLPQNPKQNPSHLRGCGIHAAACKKMRLVYPTTLCSQALGGDVASFQDVCGRRVRCTRSHLVFHRVSPSPGSCFFVSFPPVVDLFTLPAASCTSGSAPFHTLLVAAAMAQPPSSTPPLSQQTSVPQTGTRTGKTPFSSSPIQHHEPVPFSMSHSLLTLHMHTLSFASHATMLSHPTICPIAHSHSLISQRRAMARDQPSSAWSTWPARSMLSRMSPGMLRVPQEPDQVQVFWCQP